MTAAPYLLGRRGPGAAVIAGGGSGDSDGGFVEQPVVTTTASGNTTVTGKVKPGSFGKFVYPLATLTAGRQYTFRYTPQFSQLAQQGKLAMVGFGLKNGNDFHIVGLRGDGSTGLHKYKVNGTPPNGWNKQTGHTESDGGAAANGTQAGPNYIRLVVSADGATYKFQTSPDNVTYTDEYTGQTPTPFSNVSGVLTFGIALWFNNADAGPFSIVIDQFADAAAPSGPTVTYIGTFTDILTIDPHTFTADVGAAGPKLVVVCPHSLRNAAAQRTLVSVSIDGTLGTLAGQNGINDALNEGTQTGIAYREISTGGVITIIDDWSAIHSFSAADVYTITGYTSNVHVDFKTATGDNPTISTLTVSANGCVIASASGVEPATGAFAFSGVSLDHDQQCDSGNGIVHMREAAGHATGLAATSTYNVQASSAAGFEVVAAVSFV
ncbi:hypothetical protein [Mesorhizobium sp. M7A.F.Ce.TU.012.03.2.1]|uniref:hypothetical protein n=1 Tax=Mesorhizobium sp. M7A.F.Ce.TU.012.03.2.1 TaxID=2493681 RepID=UPI000FDAD49B|nr:hypothetical protein [Mesorhizobium sp. M7A.F.Ce.TU.012.03.2.1]AZV21489.1 hypothetical protein EJ079_21845 [Mesorhizobium sp. M7A.F.Ce.TU.012.03.2.1]